MVFLFLSFKTFLILSINTSETTFSKLIHKSSFLIGSFELCTRFIIDVLIPLKLKLNPSTLGYGILSTYVSLPIFASLSTLGPPRISEVLQLLQPYQMLPLLHHP